ncbi:hypothetical protein EYF80_033520 [Liparis tanakae]|uniref:Uncharacterized protein n=1 Tax=Liparis tanakae TaxID=230148 RepID=A0A4Z2GUP4_9TELE|nr:hypothetical protein EYF80_033520 [Liparis tanakae]
METGYLSRRCVFFLSASEKVNRYLQKQFSQCAPLSFSVNTPLPLPGLRNLSVPSIPSFFMARGSGDEVFARILPSTTCVCWGAPSCCPEPRLLRRSAALSDRNKQGFTLVNKWGRVEMVAA